MPQPRSSSAERPTTPSPGRDAGEDHGWLCPTDAHRVRMLDMGPRVRRARNMSMGAMAVAIVAASPLVGWLTVPLFAVAIVASATLDARVRRARRPEGVVARALALMILLTALSAALTGGVTSPVLPLLVIPVAVTAARFRAAVVWSAAGLAALAAVGTAVVASGPGNTLDHPLNLLGVGILLVAVTAATTALMDAELEFRSQSVLDPLTGLLNRSGLEARFAEIAEQARLLSQPVCLIMCDLDHFKQVNDKWGHERGDRVLREVAYAMRKSLRSFELFYRLGGEEFLVLLPGTDLGHGTMIAENLRAAVKASQADELGLTASFGLSTAIGADVGFLPLYRAADAALYRAKRAGRDTVVVVPPAELPELGRADWRGAHGDGTAWPAPREVAAQS